MTPRLYHAMWILMISTAAACTFILMQPFQIPSDLTPHGFDECRLRRGVPIVERYPSRLIACIARDAIIDMDAP